MKNKSVKIFTMPQQFPCGPNSSCCGPVGQSEEEVRKLKNAIKEKIDCDIEVINVLDGSKMKNHLPVVRLFRSLGAGAIPIITLNDEIISVGNPSPEEAVSLLKEKFA